MPLYTGSCLCKRVSFEVDAEPVVVSCCHCTNCKKYTGTVFTTNIVFPVGTLKVRTGEENIRVYDDIVQDSGNKLGRYFCNTCGAPLWNDNCEGGTKISVFYSALDSIDSKKLEPKAPEVEYYAKDRVEWLPDFGAKKAATKPGRE